MSNDRVSVEAVSRDTEFSSLDGLGLRGTFVVPASSHGPAVVLVHGGGVTREEGGYFTRLATGLAEAGLASLRLDLRGHGHSEGTPQEVTLSGVTNDIRAAIEHACAEVGDSAVHVVGASFGGGLSAYVAACSPELVRRLVLFNPLLNYKKRFVDDKPYWTDDHIDAEAGRELAEHGFLEHSPTFRLSRALLNEVFYIQPHRMLGQVQTPTLFVHGTGDTFVPVESSRAAVAEVGAEARLLEIDGAQHGFAVHDDPQYRDPQTQQWQATVTHSVVDWFTTPA